jgi:hypothetical protein
LFGSWLLHYNLCCHDSFWGKECKPKFYNKHPCLGHDYYITICLAMTLFEAKHVSPNFYNKLVKLCRAFKLVFHSVCGLFCCHLSNSRCSKWQEGKKGEQCCLVHPNEQNFVSYNQLTIGINLSSITNDPNVWRQHTILHIIFTFEV